MFGLILQILTVISSLSTAYLLSKKGLEKWGYLIGFITIPFWVIMEYYYQQWFYFILNPIYFYIWGKGIVSHWRQNEKELEKS